MFLNVYLKCSYNLHCTDLISHSEIFIYIVLVFKNNSGILMTKKSNLIFMNRQ